MKLQNKRTGEIATVEGFGSAEGEIQMTYTIDNDETKLYLYCTPSLTTFNEEWEDYNELEYWYIDSNGDILFSDLDDDKLWKDLAEERKQIGNYFETKEEAEKAVEKLKAWKRLKAKGFRFSHHSFLDRRISYKVPVADEKIGKDLDLLFGGEE